MRVTTWTDRVGCQRQKPLEEIVGAVGDFSQLQGAALMGALKKLTSLHQRVTKTIMTTVTGIFYTGGTLNRQDYE